VRLPRQAPPAPRAAPARTSLPRDNILKGVEQSLAHAGPIISTCCSFTSRPRKPWSRRGALELAAEPSAFGGHGSSACPRRSHVDHIAKGVFDVFQVPTPAVEAQHGRSSRRPRRGSGIVVRGGAPKARPTEER
jgi:hypothetical protein